MNTLINFYKFLTKSNSLRSKILFSSLWLLCFIPLNINPEEFQKFMNNLKGNGQEEQKAQGNNNQQGEGEGERSGVRPGPHCSGEP